MTKAVCFRCGDIKFGAFNPCGACGETPRNDEDLILSLAMTDHYFNDPSLRQLGDSVKAGNLPKLDESTRSNLLKNLEEFKKTPAGRIMRMAQCFGLMAQLTASYTDQKRMLQQYEC